MNLIDKYYTTKCETFDVYAGEYRGGGFIPLSSRRRLRNISSPGQALSGPRRPNLGNRFLSTAKLIVPGFDEFKPILYCRCIANDARSVFRF